jgi:hypothetical protein
MLLNTAASLFACARNFSRSAANRSFAASSACVRASLISALRSAHHATATAATTVSHSTSRIVKRIRERRQFAVAGGVVGER